MHEPSARFSLCCALPFLATKVSWEPHDRTEAYGRFSRQSSRQHDTTRFPPRVSRTNPPSHTLLEAWVSGRLFDQLSNPSTNADTKVLPEPATGPDTPTWRHVVISSEHSTALLSWYICLKVPSHHTDLSQQPSSDMTIARITSLSSLLELPSCAISRSRD